MLILHPLEQDFACGWGQQHGSQSGAADKGFHIFSVPLKLDWEDRELSQAPLCFNCIRKPQPLPFCLFSMSLSGINCYS